MPGKKVAARQSSRSGISVDIAKTKQRRVGDVDMGKTSVLPEGHVVGEITLELVAQHFLFALERIDAGITREQAGRNPTEGCGGDGAKIGQEVEAAGLVLRRRR